MPDRPRDRIPPDFHLLEFFWLAAGLTVPLVFNPWGYNAFELPKALLLRVLVLGALPALLLIPARQLRIPAGALPAALWAGVLLLATLFSTNPRASFWGSYERQQGILTLGTGLLLFALIAAGLRTRRQADRLWTALIWSSLPALGYGLLQALGLDPLHWKTDAAAPILGPVGRSNFFGSYLTLVIPLTAGRTLIAHRRWPLALLLAGQIGLLFLTQARAAWMGLLAGALVFGWIWAAAGHNRRLQRIILGSALAGLAFLLLLNWPGGPLVPLAGQPGLERLATLGQTAGGSNAARLTLWRAAPPLIAARPWLGYGPETLRAAFAPIYPPQLVYYQGREAVVDRLHNGILDLIASTGLAGLLAWLALAGTAGCWIWKGTCRAADRREAATWAALGGALIGHGVDLLFSFETLTGLTWVWLLLGWAAAAHRGLELEGISEPAPQRPWGLILPPTAAALLLIGMLAVRPLLADHAFWQSLQATQSPRIRLEAAEQAVRFWPVEPEYRLNRARALAWAGQFPAAEREWQAADALGGGDPWIHAAGGALYVQAGQLARAETIYRQTVEQAPNLAVFHAALGDVLWREGALSAARTALERAVALDSTHGAAYARLAAVYQALNLPDQAHRAQQEAARWGAPPE